MPKSRDPGDKETAGALGATNVKALGSVANWLSGFVTVRVTNPAASAGVTA